ncbi:hypothetical protein CIG75_18455 [Tumebacillus algifaecis]|uniref:Schlafen AlbA-2 domain-containing protein n=1 Tax=Tumebacillus algifaecis TaxID=1214604 RepID=A0A223D5I4_9BACL|nr:ATP-binding protein [Tumebacillus algifaecis]ASS76723.1 hypothetical protein CIG75_18455 [Tumebacillus algifaecis]
MNRLISCQFIAVLQQVERDTVRVRLFHEVEREGLAVFKERIRKKVVVPRLYFDAMVQAGVFAVEGADQYQPSEVSCGVGFDIYALGRKVQFDICFHDSIDQLWQEVRYRLEDIVLDQDVFESYTYRLRAISRYLYLGREDNVFRAIAREENQEIEFKLDFQNSKEKILKSVVAFANSNNGNLFLGISDDKRMVGINHEISRYGSEDRYLLAVSSLLHARIYPLLSPFPEVRILTVSGRKIVHLYVPVGTTMYSVLETIGGGQQRRRVAVKQNNQSVWVDDPYVVAELYIKRRIGPRTAATLGLL